MRLRLGVLAGYIAISFAFFGIQLLPHFGRSYIGSGADPELYVWAFAWLPHALGHGENPIVTHALWAPTGVNLAWSAPIFGLAVPLAPVTVLAGPVAAFNVAAILAPALSAWTAFLLCLYLTRRVWPSLLGGYLFGFSSYELGQELAHLPIAAVWLLPLITLLVLRLHNGDISPRRGAVWLGLVLAWQLTLSTEVALTATIALAVSLLLVGRTRSRLFVPVASAYLLAAVVASPLLWYALTDFRTGSFNDPNGYSADLLNAVIPTGIVELSGHVLNSISARFPANIFERGAYLGLPLLAIVVWFGARRWRTQGGRFLLVALVLGWLASLGTALFVEGHRVVALPWALIAKLPGFDNVLPARLSVYTALAAAVIGAVWSADERVSRAARIVLSVLAIVAILPGLRYTWTVHPTRVAFFTRGLYRSCLKPSDDVIVLPYDSNGDSMLWQAESEIRFRLTGGYVGAHPPAAFEHLEAVRALDENVVPPHGARDLEQLIGVGQVRAIVVASYAEPEWRSLLAPLGKPQRIGGVDLYLRRCEKT